MGARPAVAVLELKGAVLVAVGLDEDLFGPIAVPLTQPWIWHTGCCPEQKWKCGACGHNFGGEFEFGGQNVDGSIQINLKGEWT